MKATNMKSFRGCHWADQRVKGASSLLSYNGLPLTYLVVFVRMGLPTETQSIVVIGGISMGSGRLIS